MPAVHIRRRIAAIRSTVYFLVGVLTLGGCRASEKESGLVLGFAENQPAVFFPFKTGMIINLKGINLDKFGYVAGLEEEIVTQNETTRIKITMDSGLKPTEPNTYRYQAEINGRVVKSLTLAEWEKTEAKGCLGFAPMELGGVILRSTGALEMNITTNFAYDDFGRRMISKQEFMHEGVKYQITYSQHAFDKFGRLNAYSAQIRQAE
jgi:hypothetical protein